MQQLIRLFEKYHGTVLFLLLQAISLNFILTESHYHRSYFLNGMHQVSSTINHISHSVKSPFTAQQSLDSLSAQNSRLLELLYGYQNQTITPADTVIDTLYRQSYSFIPAKVIKKPLDQNFNFFTLNKGADDNIKVNMGVMNAHAILGVIRNTSQHYSTLMSLLHEDCKVSARVKGRNSFGVISYDPTVTEKNTVKLIDVPKDDIVRVGDEVITSGYSSFFPENIPIGLIRKINAQKSGNFYDIEVLLHTDPKAADRVHIIQSIDKFELDSLIIISE